MTAQVPARRLKMNARRRSPFMLLLGILTAGAPGYAAGSGAQRREKVTATGFEAAEPHMRRPGEVGWHTEPAVSASRTRSEPRVKILWQTGLQKTWVSGRRSTPTWRREDFRKQFTHDLGLLVRDRDSRHHWGGATTVIWQEGTRTLYAVKAIRRWSLDPASSVYLQFAPGMIAGGEETGVDISPGGLLELELGNTWVALTTGVHVVGWRTRDDSYIESGSGVNTTFYTGVRTNGLVGLGVYLGLIIAFAATYRGGDWN